MTRSSTRSPAGADCAEPSSKRLTLRHSGYLRSMTHSIQIGMDAMPIWMKYPRVVDHLGERRCQYNLRAAFHTRFLTL